MHDDDGGAARFVVRARGPQRWFDVAAFFGSVGLVVVATSGSSGCAPPECEFQEPLVFAEGWRFVPPTEDVLWPPPPDAPVCTVDDIQVATFGEDEAVEIDTRLGCGWATVEQALGVGLAAGDRVQVRIFYFAQATFPAAEAEVAVALGDDVIVSERVPIPSSSGLVAPRVVIDRAVAAGTPARFHVGNHGDNSWNLIELSRVYTAACAD